MLSSTWDLSEIAKLLVGATAVGVLCAGVLLRSRNKLKRECDARLSAERAGSRHLCFSTLQSLSYAIEAGEHNVGHLDCVQRVVMALCRALSISEEDAETLRAASLLHNIGRLGVPDHILNKAGQLTPEEQEKLRTHPVLGARILAPVPFPWPIVPLVRHHAEHWDGSGYPDGLSGADIPFGARILAVANAYSALQHDRPFRTAFSSTQALAEIEARSGTQFDPAVVAAFRLIASDIRLEAVSSTKARLNSLTDSAEAISANGKDNSGTLVDARSALHDIAAAQRETHALYRLANAVAGSLHLKAISTTLLECVHEIVDCDASVLFLPDEDAEQLHAEAAFGLNERHLLGSSARIGTYLTGRAFSRGETARATFMADDVLLRDVSDPWVPFRSTLIIPLSVSGQSLGTINLYSQTPEAFTGDDVRVMRLVATQASHAIESACRFASVQETAYTDALTGLRNARYLREFLEREINRAGRDEAAIAVLNIDLDNFKPINDRFGHARGDEILKEVASILLSQVRNYDLAARYAGDEFVVVLTQTTRLQAEVVATKLKLAVERHGQRLCSREPGFPLLGISIGVALYPEDGQNLQALLCKSDAAMYSDKAERKSGRAA